MFYFSFMVFLWIPCADLVTLWSLTLTPSWVCVWRRQPVKGNLKKEKYKQCEKDNTKRSFSQKDLEENQLIGKQTKNKNSRRHCDLQGAQGPYTYVNIYLGNKGELTSHPPKKWHNNIMSASSVI